MHRLRELDFLRGIAILLVLLRHQFISPYTINMGWIGVDLFFVLSGFLVSGLLFKEYLKNGSIRPGRFLIRRGFKIYPVYYIFYIPYLIQLINNGYFKMSGVLSDLTFLQNYVGGFGFAYAASWSLAVEEHFYFGLSLILWSGLKYNRIKLEKKYGHTAATSPFAKALLAIMLCWLIMRIFSNLISPEQMARNTTMTHLRLDSLLAGVLISYLYYFRFDFLQKKFQSNKRMLICMAIAGVLWTPFIDPLPSFFVKTFGFTLLYISFGILLTYFLLTADINPKLNKVFSATVVNMVSKIGFCSYSIYIIHTYIDRAEENIIAVYHLYDNNLLNFLITSIVSILLGFVMTYKIENYFLSIRNKYFPGRA
jgi:peptidoglycan/LPS O-acetylase OafA/YrhL